MEQFASSPFLRPSVLVGEPLFFFAQLRRHTLTVPRWPFFLFNRFLVLTSHSFFPPPFFFSKNGFFFSPVQGLFLVPPPRPCLWGFFLFFFSFPFSDLGHTVPLPRRLVFFLFTPLDWFRCWFPLFCAPDPNL